MSYTIDVYRRTIPAERSWPRFALYVAYFPQLIAGPIVRARDFLPQLQKQYELTVKELESGLYLIVRGLVKKIVLADFLAIYAELAFNSPDAIGWLPAWIGLYAFCFQIYFDFSGYSDIAIGCARLMGFKIPDNFNLPYMATSFSDFWKRWHISLSSWLRDYLYIPLGGNRNKRISQTYINLMITMVLGGLWHGAAWHFVLWGVVHALFLSIERVWCEGLKEGGRGFIRLPWMWVQRIFVFQGVLLTWLIFRCESNWHLAEYGKALFRSSSLDIMTHGHLVAISIILGGFLAQGIAHKKSPAKVFLQSPIIVKSFVYTIAVVLILIFGTGPAKPFIYFKF